MVNESPIEFQSRAYDLVEAVGRRGPDQVIGM